MFILIEIIGIVLIISAFIDIFLTVLYARIGHGLLSPRISKLMWSIFRLFSRIIKSKKDQTLSFGGPIILISIAATWGVLLIFGFALVYYPFTGSDIAASQEVITRSFSKALYFSGMNFTTLGTGDIYSKSDSIRILMIVQSFTGFFTLTLTVTYLFSIYSALIRRNTFALILHTKTAVTGNPVELLVHLGPEDNFAPARSEADSLTFELLNLLESHHAYPVLHYFRFKEPYYALARMMFIILDATSLSLSCLDQKKHHQFLQSTGITQLWEGSLLLLEQLSKAFISQKNLDFRRDITDETLDGWRKRYDFAISQIKTEGISPIKDTEAGFNLYVSYRSKWDSYVSALSDFMEYDRNEIQQ